MGLILRGVRGGADIAGGEGWGYKPEDNIQTYSSILKNSISGPYCEGSLSE